MSIPHLNAAWSARIADPQAKLVLVRLADMAKKDTGLCWPPMEDIVMDTGLHKSTVCRKLDLLERIGWISRKRKKLGSEITVFLEQAEVAHSDFSSNSRSRTQPLKKSHGATSYQNSEVAVCDQEVALCDQEVAVCDFSILENPNNPKKPSLKGSEIMQKSFFEIADITDDWDTPNPKPITPKKLTPDYAEAIYNEYPKKVSKAAALKAIIKAAKNHSPDFLLGRTKAYAAAIKWKDRQFIPYPATWFSAESFNDDPREWNPPTKNQFTSASQMGMSGILIEPNGKKFTNSVAEMKI
jgi:Helix-turn-helix domain